MINAIVFRHSLQRLSVRDKRAERMVRHRTKIYVYNLGLNPDLLRSARVLLLAYHERPPANILCTWPKAAL